jgi:hypothetical protein
MGPIVMRISLMKRSPSGFIFSASEASKMPSTTAAAMATKTRRVMLFRGLGLSAKVSCVSIGKIFLSIACL